MFGFAVWRTFGLRIAVLMAGLSVASSFAVARADDPLERYNLAVGLYKQSHWKRASDSFKQFLADHGQHEKASFAKLYRGLSLVNLEEFKEARDVLRGFAKDHPQNQNVPLARFRIAECSYLLNDAAAQQELNAFLTENPKEPLVERALFYLGDVQLRASNAMQAEATFQRALTQFPSGALVDDVRFGLAQAILAQHKTDAALLRFEEIVAAKGSRAADARLQVGEIRFQAKQYAEAIASYEAFLQQFPNHGSTPLARLNLGYAYFQQGKFKEAAARFEEAGQEKSQQNDAFFWRGVALRNSGDAATAKTVLAAVIVAAGTQPPADGATYHLAACERQLGNRAEAKRLYLDAARRWPAGDFADDGLFQATELALDAGEYPEAAVLLDEFEKQHAAKSSLRFAHDLQRGRWILASPAKDGTHTAAQLADAASRFERVQRESTSNRLKSQSRYFLGMTRQLEGRHADAVQVLSPLVAEVRRDGESSELPEALVLLAESQLAIGETAQAEASLAESIQRHPQGRLAAKALSLLATAQGKQQRWSEAERSIATLRERFPTSSFGPQTLLSLAEMADAKEQWATSNKFYELLVTASAGTENQAFALRGVAWSEFKRRRFLEAEAAFSQLAKDFPQHVLSPEARYYRAESMREAGQLEAAVTGFRETLDRHKPTAPPEAGAEGTPPVAYAYRSALQLARLHRQAGRVEPADAAYAELAKLFPKAKAYDRVLNEWAVMNYEANRYDRADELFRRLMQEAPESELADNAALSLAESDLVAERIDAAEAAFKSLAESPRSDDDVKRRSMLQLGLLALERRNWDEADAWSTKLLASNPETDAHWFARYARAESIVSRASASSPQMDQALADLRELEGRQAMPGVGDASWFERVPVLTAEIAVRRKQYDVVDKVVARARAADPRPRLLHQVEEIAGRAYKQQAKFAEARTSFERVVGDPACQRTELAAKCQFLFGETFFLQEKWDDAFLAYQKVYASHPFPEWQAAALLQSAKCDEKQSHWKDAAKTYELLLKEFPTSAVAAEAKDRLAQVKNRAT